MTAWGTGTSYENVLAARSSDNGQTWSAPLQISANRSNTSASGSGLVQLATNRAGTVLAAWHSMAPLDGSLSSDFDIHLSRSSDFGLSWSSPLAVSPGATTDNNTTDERVQMAGDGHTPTYLGGLFGWDAEPFYATTLIPTSPTAVRGD